MERNKKKSPNTFFSPVSKRDDMLFIHVFFMKHTTCSLLGCHLESGHHCCGKETKKSRMVGLKFIFKLFSSKTPQNHYKNLYKPSTNPLKSKSLKKSTKFSLGNFSLSFSYGLIFLLKPYLFYGSIWFSIFGAHGLILKIWIFN
jgi:hypothetical protein